MYTGERDAVKRTCSGERGFERIQAVMVPDAGPPASVRRLQAPMLLSTTGGGTRWEVTPLPRGEEWCWSGT